MLTKAHSRRFSVVAGILPAVELGRPARRRKRSHTPTVLKNFRTALIFHRSFRAAGRQPSTADETSAATTPSPLFPEACQTVPRLTGTAIVKLRRSCWFSGSFFWKQICKQKGHPIHHRVAYVKLDPNQLFRRRMK